jgi:two-component system, OmpR family, response regulator RegX3
MRSQKPSLRWGAGSRAWSCAGGSPVALVYLVEDDEAVAAEVCALLSSHGHDVRHFATPHEFFYQLGKRAPLCVLVDWLLPEMPGPDVVRRIRRLLGTGVGVLMLTAMDSEDNVVQGLDAGADDYVTKPYANRTLLARVDAMLRRVTVQHQVYTVLDCGPYHFDFAVQSTQLEGRAVVLTPREFDLAWTLFSHPGRLWTKAELQSAIWGKGDGLAFHTIAQHVYSVRKKLELAGHGVRLLTVYGTGYRLELPASWTHAADPAGQ